MEQLPSLHWTSRIPLHVLLVAACVGSLVSVVEKPDIAERLRNYMKESRPYMNGKLMGRIKEDIDNMPNYWKNGCNRTLREGVVLSPEQRQYLTKRTRRQEICRTSWVKRSIEDVNMKSGVADELFQGDMLLSKEQQEEVAKSGESRPKRQAYIDKTNPRVIWSGVVNYTLDKGLDERAKEAFKNATYLWMNDTCIDFMEDDTEESEDIILVYKDYGCWAEVGRHGGWQLISLGEGCEAVPISRNLRVGTAAHEIGHALGFSHTHTRHDRDQFITVLEENINCSSLSQFKARTPDTNNNYNLTYDYGSIMHYGVTSFSNDSGKFTVIPKDVMYTETLGSHIISFYDLLMMNMHYNCTAVCKAVPNAVEKCRNGGFAHPRNCSKCICPSGYGGQFCDERPPGCGAVLNATQHWTPLEDPLNSTEPGRDGFGRCNYWITAPDNKTVEVKITKIVVQVPQFEDEGCKKGGVEIKTHEDQRRTGYRFCSPDAVNTTLISNLSRVPVIIFKLIESAGGVEEELTSYEDESDELVHENGDDTEGENGDYYDEEEDLGVRLEYRYI